MANLVKCAICGMAGTESSFRDKAYGGEPLCFRCASRAKANIAICEGVDVKDVIIGNYTVEQLRDAKNGYEVNVDEARTKNQSTFVPVVLIVVAIRLSLLATNTKTFLSVKQLVELRFLVA